MQAQTQDSQWLRHILTCTGSWEFLSYGPGDSPEISDATDIIISLDVRGRQLVACLKNNLDATLSIKSRGKQLINNSANINSKTPTNTPTNRGGKKTYLYNCIDMTP